MGSLSFHCFFGNRKFRKYLPSLLIAIICVLVPSIAFAQRDSLGAANLAIDSKDYKKAADIFSKAYKESPGDADIYQDYLNVLIVSKDFKGAEQLVGQQASYQNRTLLQIDLGKILLASGKEKKALEQFDAAVSSINGDDLLVQQMAKAFIEIGRDDYAILAYERARNLFQNPYLYSGPISKLYAKTGATDKAVEALLDGSGGMMVMMNNNMTNNGVEDIKSTLLEILGTDPKRLQLGQKALVRRINQNPENSFYSELLTWVYTQKGDWEGALIQLQAVDERNRESGNRLLDFARSAAKEKQMDIAIKSVDAVIEKGKENALYPTARMMRLDLGMQQIENNFAFTVADVQQQAKMYEAFFAEMPQFSTTTSMRDYAALEATYNNNPKKAIQLLKDAMAQPTATKDFVGNAKLEMGDYQVLDGKVWEASLTYSQVDKAFREDLLGEEARFRNAKLAYYRGDFEWAQGQLTVLKASTSELIANDALYLSVLITENTPDSIQAPLLSYARADLLLFQNKDDEAVKLLDSIAKAFPKHTLNDDILMFRANIATKHRDYTAALGYLKEVFEKYEKDVLADDAVFKTATIFDQYLNKPDEAKKYYEHLIIDYPGSTYVQSARLRLQSFSEPGGVKAAL